MYLLFGDLTPGEDGTHRFTYHGLPRTFRIAVSSAQGAQATESSFTRTVFYTHLTYNWATNTITKATSTVGFYLTQFLSTLIPTLLVEGRCCGCSASAAGRTGWCSLWST